MKDYSFEEPFEKYPLAMAYVPWQHFTQMYENLEKDTGPVLFSPSLTNPLQEGDASNEQRRKKLYDIGIADFVLTDLMLYLDTHPSDQKAMEYFNHYARIKTQMEREFARDHYPLRKDLAESNRDWRWGSAPLPWEGGCN